MRSEHSASKPFQSKVGKRGEIISQALSGVWPRKDFNYEKSSAAAPSCAEMGQESNSAMPLSMLDLLSEAKSKT
eukprot:10857836-Karenia_brevis.AAC.1